MANLTKKRGNNDADWWRGAVIYQIYPRSYQDNNNDGIGDLAGITSRLPYLADLGVDALWISPFFTSPMKDFGYDVSNYLDIDPLFGNMTDFETLVQTAHEHGLRIMIDLVLSHSSDQHPWFIESRRDRTNPKADWYVWADPKPDGTSPNNWLSIFGGSAWTWDSRRCQYYMHNFLTSQPDLNFHNPEVQDALLDVTEFWLQKGVDGFRLDTINFYFCDKKLRDNPPLPPEQRNDSIAPSVNPYNHQNHLYDKSQPENVLFLEKMRILLDSYPGSAIVGEVGDAQKGMEILAEYTQGNKRAHMCYAFDFLCAQLPTPAYFVKIIKEFETKAPTSWSCWAFSNHDVVRHASRWERTGEHQLSFLKLLFSLLASLKGSICIYQGEELGLKEANVPFEDLQDPYGIEFWPEFKGRDGCRTPMVWDDTPTGGFSKGTPWLPVEQDHLALAVSNQKTNSDGLLQYYTKMLAFRSQTPALVKGSIIDLKHSEEVLQFTRTYEQQTVIAYFNFAEETASITLSEQEQPIHWSSADALEKSESNQINLPPCTAVFTTV